MRKSLKSLLLGLILQLTQALLVFAAVPNAPSGLKVTALSSKQVKLTWTDNSSDELGFKVERSLDTKTYTLIAQPPANTTSYIDGGVLAWNTYYYRVRSYNSSGASYCGRCLQLGIRTRMASGKCFFKWSDCFIGTILSCSPLMISTGAVILSTSSSAR